MGLREKASKYYKNVWLWIGGAFVFILGATASPILERSGEILSDYIFQRTDRVNLLNCTPLQEARIVFRDGDRISLEKDMDLPNPSTIIVHNLSDTPLTDFEMVVLPLAARGGQPRQYQITVDTSSLISLDDINVSKSDQVFRIQVEQIGKNDVVWIEILYGEPVIHLVEIKSNEFLIEKHFLPGCNHVPEIYSAQPTVEVFKYVDDFCGKNAEVFSCPVTAFEGEINFQGDGPQTVEEIIFYNGKRHHRVALDNGQTEWRPVEE